MQQNNYMQYAKPQLSFGEAVKKCFKTITFKGRARRSEYWWFQVLASIYGFIMGFTSVLVSEGGYDTDAYFASIVIFMLVGLVLWVPSICVTVRRLHDIGKSGWWYWISAIPYVGSIILLVMMCKDSEQEENEYGPSPKY